MDVDYTFLIPLNLFFCFHFKDDLAQQREKRRLEREERRKQREAESNQAESERQKAREERRRKRESGMDLWTNSK